MKTLICGLCLLMLAGSAFAATGTFDLYTDFNLIALPNVPLDSLPTSVFATTPDMLEGYLAGFDPITQSGVGYSQWEPELFGGLLLGDGYEMASTGPATITFEGLDSGVPTAGVKTDMWISLPGYDSDFSGTADQGGWHLIGNPYAENVVVLDKVRFTDGTDVKTWQEAYDLGWVTETFQGLDGATQSGIVVDINGWEGTDFLPGHGYWFWTNVPNLAMIITAPL